MSNDDIIRMAREAGFSTGTRDYADGNGGHPFVTPVASGSCLPEIERFAALVEAKASEKEREAMVAEAAKRGLAMKNEDPFEDYVRDIANDRARG